MDREMSWRSFGASCAELNSLNDPSGRLSRTNAPDIPFIETEIPTKSSGDGIHVPFPNCNSAN